MVLRIFDRSIQVTLLAFRARTPVIGPQPDPISKTFCSFVVGLILCGQAGMGNMEAGNMYEMYAVAAGVIGGISPLGGTGLLLGTLAGASVWQTLENGLNMIGAQVGIQRLVIGIIVVFAVLLDVVVRNGVFKKKPAKN